MMGTQRLSVIAVVLTCLLQAQGADKYSDENRPYEFGFTIPEEQHRHEKKDENGLIEGEFGFITADGVYHVTVYATDENGNFKILSMKNIRVKPYPTSPERKGKEIPFPAPGNQPQEPQVNLQEPARSCSHCSIPTTPKPVAGDEYPQYPQGVDNVPSYPNYPAENYPHNPENYPLDNYPDSPREPSLEYLDPLAVQNPQAQGPLIQGERNPKQFYPEEPATKPELIYAQMQIVDPNTDIYAKKPGEQDGLPQGLNPNDMKLILYTFNYTVGFHGHHEVGYTDGTKQGYYFVTGRNGVKTRVDYEADEKGFRPKITQEVLDLISEDVPKPETEKDPKYGLKGYEFKWLYYPVDSKRR